MSSPEQRQCLDFPILVYQEEGKYVAESIVTSTVAVADSREEALNEVAELVLAEVRAVEEFSKGDWTRFLHTLTCPIPHDRLQKYFFEAKSVQPAQKAKNATQGVDARFTPKEVALSA